MRVTDDVLVAKRALHKQKIQSAMATARGAGGGGRGKALPGIRKKPSSCVKRHTFNTRRVAVRPEQGS